MDNKNPFVEQNKNNIDSEIVKPEFLDSSEILRNNITSIQEMTGKLLVSYTVPGHIDRFAGYRGSSRTEHKWVGSKQVRVNIDGFPNDFVAYFIQNNEGGFERYDEENPRFTQDEQSDTANSQSEYAEEFIDEIIQKQNPFSEEKLFNGRFDLGTIDPMNEGVLFLGITSEKNHFIATISQQHLIWI